MSGDSLLEALLDLLRVAPFAFTFAVLSAWRDKLHHRWGDSFFYGLAGGDKHHYFGHANHVWLRRFVDNDTSKGYVPALLKPFGSERLAKVGWLVYLWQQMLIPFWDAWHLFKSLEVLLTLTLIVYAFGLHFGWVLPLYLFFGLVFEVFYRRDR